MIFKDKLIEVISYFDEGKTVLLPTDHDWVIASRGDALGLESLSQFNTSVAYEFCILVENLDKLKIVYPHLHPRVETLLIYLEQSFKLSLPSSILPDLETVFPKATLFIQFPQNTYTKHLLGLLPYPLYALCPKSAAESGAKLDSLPKEFLSAASYICQDRDYIDESSYSVKFSYDDEGTLQNI